MECPYCKGTDFYEGPTGGMMMNVICADEECRHKFNLNTLTGELEDLKSVQPKEKTIQEREAERAKEVSDAKTAAYLEGVELFKTKGSAVDCIQQSGVGWHYFCGADLFRLAGYMDQFHGRVKESL
jgi:hypothetical protein